MRASILAATWADDFDAPEMQPEIYRTLIGAGVTLTSAEAFATGEAARKRGLPAEAVDAYALLDSDDEEFRQNTSLIAMVREAAAQDRDGDFEKSAEGALRRNDDYISAIVAEAFAGRGDFERAIEVYQIVLSHNQPGEDAGARAAQASQTYGSSIEFYQLEFKEHPCGPWGSKPLRLCFAELDVIRLNYGISLFRLNRVSEARAMWSANSETKSIEILARAWLDIADRSAN